MPSSWNTNVEKLARRQFLHLAAGAAALPVYRASLGHKAIPGLASGLTLAQSEPIMIFGNDEKRLWDDQFKPLLSPPGRGSVLILDLADPMNPATGGFDSDAFAKRITACEAQAGSTPSSHFRTCGPCRKSSATMA